MHGKEIVLFGTGVENYMFMLKSSDVTCHDPTKQSFENPLLPTTIKSMWLELYEEYKKIVEDYRVGDWGIYDDSADLNRAIAVSDAYYGDPSSVLELFKEVGKPVMIQNVDV